MNTHFPAAVLIALIGLIGFAPDAAAVEPAPPPGTVRPAIARPALTRFTPAPFSRASALRAAGLALEPSAPLYASPLWFAERNLPANDTAALTAHLRTLAAAQIAARRSAETKAKARRTARQSSSLALRVHTEVLPSATASSMPQPSKK
jgi:hypothetical protein